jgi:hypothetical protein
MVSSPDSVQLTEFTASAVHTAFEEDSSTPTSSACPGALSPDDLVLRTANPAAGPTLSRWPASIPQHLFHHHSLVIGDTDEGHPAGLRFQNNLVKGFGDPHLGGAFHVTTFSGDYRVTDNIFDGGQVRTAGIPLAHSHNATSHPSSTVPCRRSRPTPPATC